MHEYTAPALPLSREQFCRAIQVGHGRARQQLDAFGVADFRSDIFDAGVTCGVYDPQVEGFPAEWFAEFCEHAGVVKDLIASAPGAAHRDRAWRAALLLQFAQRGHPGAREALYSACEKAEYGGLYASLEILELDGQDGLVFLARKLGGLLGTDPQFHVDNGILDAFDDDHGAGSALAVLGPLAATDEAVAGYLAHLQGGRPDAGDSGRRPRMTLAQVIDAISSSSRRHLGLGYWARHAEHDDLSPILELAISASEPLVVENALRCLSGSRTLPLKPELIPLLGHSDENVRIFAARTLGRHAAALVRDAGLERLQTDLTIALELLRRNVRPADIPALLVALVPLPDIEQQHAVVGSILELLTDNEEMREPSLALYVYERSPCKNCRHSALQHLLAWERVPRWIREEACFDASEAVRDLVAANERHAT